jgi:hypothetical protein
MVVPSRVSQVVPAGTSDAEAAPRARISDIVPVFEQGSAEAAPRARASDIAPVDPAVREARAAFRQSPLGETLHGTGFSPDEDEEATTVDAGAALTEEEQLALMRRIQTAMGHSAMEETTPYGTPAPEAIQPVSATPGLEYDSRSPFKHTMLLGLPQLRPQPPSEAPPPADDASSAAVESAAPNPPTPPTSAEPALMASLVRVVGPPTQPPPRRVRRSGSSSPDGVNEPDHEAFVLTHPIVPPEARRSNVPGVLSAPGALAPGALVAASGAPISLSSANLGSGNLSAGNLSAGNIGATLGNGVASTGLGPHGPNSYVPSHGPSSHVSSNGGAGPSSVSAAGHAGAGPASVAGFAGTSLGAAGANAGSYTSNGYGNGAGTNRDLSRGSIPPQLILPPPPRPQDYEPASSPVATRSSPPPLRASIEPPAASRRTRPPASRPTASRITPPPPPSLHDLPTSDPFAGFVAPPPSIAQRGLVVVVVALAVVGVCALVAIAFGLLGKTGW